MDFWSFIAASQSSPVCTANKQTSPPNRTTHDISLATRSRFLPCYTTNVTLPTQDSQRRKTLTFFDYETQNCTLHCCPVQTLTYPLFWPVHVCLFFSLLEVLICSSRLSKSTFPKLRIWSQSSLQDTANVVRYTTLPTFLLCTNRPQCKAPYL